MLVLTRKEGEKLKIGKDIVITVVKVRGRQVKLGIDAPPTVRIFREEIYELIKNENQESANPKIGNNGGDND
jgi:carbon storage regulator